MFATAGPVRGATVLEGVRFDERAAVAGRELVLNGAGLRAAGWFKLYVAALYLPQRAGTAEQAIAQTGAKRVRVVMLREAPAVELGKAMHKGMMRNAPTAQQEALRERVGQLVAQMNTVRDVRAGAVVDFDFDADRGTTTLVLDGRPRGPAIAGADFYAALLRSFIGQHPFHRDLRAGMLGAAPVPKT
ncbi:MAG: chalcone isomerase family protein [Rubrivivax sp.]|nr:chalcone isomerase family protein [Rubrivivax sp.]